MAWVQIASGSSISDLQNVPVFESQIEEGGVGRLQLNMSATPPQSLLDGLQSRLQSYNIPLLSITSSGNQVQIIWQKGQPWLAIIIPILIGLLIVLAIVVISWIFFKQVSSVIGSGATSVLVITLCVVAVAVVTFLIILYWKRQGGKS